VSDALYDGLGRTTKTHLYEDSGSIVVQTLFDGMGRPYKVSNPERSETPVNFTITLYDSLGRVQTVTSPDGSPSTSYWVGTHVTMTDPFGAARYLLQDAFGRLTKVTEDPAGSPSDTNYLYSVLDDLTGVCQGACAVFACAFVGGRLLRKWIRPSRAARSVLSTEPPNVG